MSDPASITLSHEKVPMSQYNPRIHGCSCHGKTFCPDLICVDIEDDVPVFARRDSLEGKRTITRQAALAQPARAQAGVAELVAEWRAEADAIGREREENKHAPGLLWHGEKQGRERALRESADALAALNGGE